VEILQLELRMHVADKQYILKKCPYLLNEMISTAHQLFFYDQAGRGTIPLIVCVCLKDCVVCYGQVCAVVGNIDAELVTFSIKNLQILLNL